MKSAKEICRAIEDKVVTYGWWRVKSDIEKLLIDYGNDIREDQREIDAKIARKWLNQTDPCNIETAILNAGELPEGEKEDD